MPIPFSHISDLLKQSFAFFLLALLLSLCKSPSVEAIEVGPILGTSLSGGKTTQNDQTINAFSRPARNLPLKSRHLFLKGNALFRSRWVAADASSELNPNLGLGPTYSASTCIDCHQNDGRSLPPGEGMSGIGGLVIRLEKKMLGESAYGEQLDPLSIPGVPPEASVSVIHEKINGHYDDGTPYTLNRLKLKFSGERFGPIPENAHARVAPALIGLGLLAAIPTKTILAWADPNDKNRDGISGRPNLIIDRETKLSVLGRFGWKASGTSLSQQTARALILDIGVTTSQFPLDRCPVHQTQCQDASVGDDPEASDRILEFLTFYAGALAVPARRSTDDPKIQRGQTIFSLTGCANCHIPSTKTTKSTTQMLRFTADQVIQPFTDLLLHNMGPGLAGHSSEGSATATEWRTAPLWGLGLISKVNGQTRLLHDGRAQDIAEAIIWHGGEGANARNAFLALNKKDRADLIRFLESL